MDWYEELRRKVLTPDEAVRVIRSGDRVYLHPGTATPQLLVDAMVRRAPELENVEVVHILTFYKADYAAAGMEKHFRHRGLFIGANVREAVNRGRADFTPIFLSEIPSLFHKGILPIDVALVQLSPPDEHGFCSLGVGVDITKAACATAKVIVAEINPNMPRTLGDSFLHVNKLDYIVEADYPIQELPRVTFTEMHHEIGRNVADLIEDGSTLQMGIGGIPDAVLFFLKNKKDLGIHTEMFSDGVMELFEAGVITNDKKTLHPGKIVASFLMGSQRLYQFVDNNPCIEMHPTEYTNDPFIISQNDKMVSINSALQIDLTGQVCADSIGLEFFSGIGGQVDFVRGAGRSKGGKAVVALPSTAKDGKFSRIVPMLDPGAGVVTSRGDVHYVATEFGVVNLFGKSIRERAKALIEIAHPDFRAELEEFAIQHHRLLERCYSKQTGA
jgi:acyl-CoA hydrolase